MTPVILGGAPAANWLPLLLPLIAIAILAFAVESLVKYTRNKRHE
jgi:hypothetical protein